MTLSTTVWVLDPVDIEELWPVGQALIRQYSDKTTEPVWTDTDSWGSGANRTRMNKIGQGFCSMYIVDYMPDGSQVHDGTWAHNEDCDDPCTWGHDSERIAHYMHLDFDTSYGYRGKGGASAGDLHATIVSALGSWLDSKGIRWCWENEFTGEIHQGHDGLDQLGHGGREAANWFLTAALPAILAGVASKGGAS